MRCLEEVGSKSLPPVSGQSVDWASEMSSVVYAQDRITGTFGGGC